MLWATGNTCAGLERLSEAGHFRESYVLGRGLVESVVNMLFIVAEGDEAARRAERHASQKAFRDLDRLSKVAGEQIRIRLGDEVLSPPSEVAAAIDEFTTRGGSEVTVWTPESVDERIEAIARRFRHPIPTELHWARVAIYRHASEISHGTLFGALFALGITRPDGPPDHAQLKSHFNGHLTMVLLMSGFAVDALVRGLAETSEWPELVEESAKSVASAREYWTTEEAADEDRS